MKDIEAWAPSTARTSLPTRPYAFSFQLMEEEWGLPLRAWTSTVSPCASGEQGRPPSSYIPAILLADSTVLSSNIAIVMGPTPPGTGLIQAAFWLTES
jgi:hypothetical protein